MRDKNNWLKSIIVMGSVLLVIIGMMLRGTSAEYVVSTNIWNQGQALFGEEFGLLTELTLEESDEEEYDEPDENEPEKEAEPQPAPADTQPRQRWEYSEAELIQIPLAEAGVHSGMSAWDKAVAINNYLCGRYLE